MKKLRLPLLINLIIACLLGMSALLAHAERPSNLLINIDGQIFEVELYDNQTAHHIAKSLPQTISMSRWGNEYYGKIQPTINTQHDKQQIVFDVGEVAFWPSGNALCILFGSTPASLKDEPRLSTPGVAIGKIKGDISALKTLEPLLKNVKIDVTHH